MGFNLAFKGLMKGMSCKNVTCVKYVLMTDMNVIMNVTTVLKKEALLPYRHLYN
jgi:hypothetical protein